METNKDEPRYAKIEIIGTGGFATVYKIYDNRIKQYRAMKICTSQNRRKAFIEEALLLSSLHHPVLPRVYDIVETPDSVAMVMDYIEGKTLEQFLSERGALTVAKTIEILLSLCSAIKYLHDQTPEPLLHRDIKPQNIMITKSGQVYLLDFGSTRKYSALKVCDTEIITTIPYSAPEVLQGAQTDVRTDIYSIGLLFFMMLTGYTDPSYAREPQYRKKCPQKAIKIIDKCIALMPFERYASVDMLEKEINAMSGKAGQDKKIRWCGSQRWLSLLLVLCSASSGFAVSSVMQHHSFNVQASLIIPSDLNPQVKKLLGSPIYLKAFNEQYLQLDTFHGNHFFANMNQQAPTTLLMVEDAGAGLVAIKASNGMYLTAPKTGKGAVAAVSKTLSGACRFQMAFLGKKEGRIYFSLKSLNGYFLSSDIVNNGYVNFKSRSFGGGWETFYIDDTVKK